MIAANKRLFDDARDHADYQTDQDLRVQRHAFRLVGSLFVEIRGYLAFKGIALDSVGCAALIVFVFRHRLAAPAQLVAQNVEIVSVAWLNQVESRAALANDDAVVNLEWKTNLPIEG